jgi:hypothetical protein
MSELLSRICTLMVVNPRDDTGDEARYVRQVPWQEKAYLVGSTVVPHTVSARYSSKICLIESCLAHVVMVAHAGWS